MVTARASGERVEDESQRTEFTRVYANPDGTWTNETASGPESVRSDSGEWQDIDTTLVERNGVLVPKAVSTDLELSDGGDRVFASMSREGHDLGWRWESVLPEPVVDGATATYRDAIDGGDLVVTATATGFTHSVVLRERPEEPVEITIAVTTDGGDLVEGADGQLKITKPNGNGAVVTAPAPVMWDASAEADAGPADSEPVDAGPSGEALLVDTVVDETASGAPELTLTPDAAFLSDSDTVYPVTIDPSFTYYSTGDTWVSNQTPSSQETSTELRVGTQDAGTTKSRSYVRFNELLGMIPDDAVVNSASLVMRNFESLSCAGSSIEVAQIASDWTLSSISWSNTPAMTSLHQATFSPAMGYTSCPAGDATWDVTGIVTDWQTGATWNRGLRIKAADETVTKSYRRYRSANNTDNTLHPRINVTYNRVPGTPEAGGTSGSSYTPPGGSPTWYIPTTSPTFIGWASDGDPGSAVRLHFEVRATPTDTGTMLGQCDIPTAAGGSVVMCSATLAEDASGYFRAIATDGVNWSGWTAWKPIRVAATTPAAPVISCPAPYTTGSWHTSPPPADLSCTISAIGSGNSAPAYIRWSRDGSAETTTAIAIPSQNPSVSKITVTLPNTAGGHSIVASAQSPSGLTSPSATFGTGYGPLAMSTPTPRASGQASLTTSGPVVVSAEGAAVAAGAAATVRWRVAGSGAGPQAGWKTASVPDLSVVTSGGTTAVSGSVDISAFPGINNERTTLVELQVCLEYTGTSTCTWSNSPVSVLKVPHAFGPTNPVSNAGPGSVALLTGEFMTTETDVDEPGYNNRLTISRTHSTFEGSDGRVGIFGPGWTASLDGPGTGFSGSELYDSTLEDGTIALVDSEGNALIWARSLPATWRTTSEPNLPGGESAWAPVDDDTRLSGISLKVTGAGAATTATVTDVDGTETTFAALAAPSAGEPYEFVVKSVQEAGQTAKSTYSTNAAGQVTRILAPVPPGVTCPASGPLNPGCRGLVLTYGAGSLAGRLAMVNWVNGSTSKLVAGYIYDSTGRLSSVTDVRTNLVTSYTYDGAGHSLASITPPGLKPYRLTYDSQGRLKDVDRDKPTGSGTNRLATIRYDIPRDGTAGLPNVGPLALNDLHQLVPPTYGAAVFGASAPNVPAAIGDISASEWQWASLSFADFRGRTTNTADYGTGRWLLDATEYDTRNNPIRELSAGDVVAIRDGKISAADAGTLKKYDAVMSATGGVTALPAGSVLTETFGPARQAVINDAGDLAWVRPHTRISYDEGAPHDGIKPSTGTGYGLATKKVVRPWSVSAGTDITAPGTIEAETRTGYDPIGNDPSGWVLARPTSSTTEMGAGQVDITATARFDPDGRLIETRQPKSDGADAGTRQLVYYTAGANAADVRCASEPRWAGLVCLTRYAGASASGALPVTHVTAYDTNLNPLTAVESVSGATRRTTTNTYDSAGRRKSSWTVTSGVTGSTFANGQEAAYDPTTGLPSATRGVDATGTPTGDPITTGYDTWGRPTTYEPAPGETTTTTYNDKGQLAAITNPHGTTTYRYDGATSNGNGNDANGKTERRGLLTSVSTTRPSAAAVEFAGAYNADGTLVTQTLPGDITQRTVTDTAGDLVSMSYDGFVSVGGWDMDDVPWIAWSQHSDYLGRVAREWTPQGAGYFANTLTTGAAAGYSHGYTYDRAGRLTRVTDHTAPAGGGLIDPDPASWSTPAETTCETRNYTFDANGNRLSLTRRGANADGSCSTTVASTNNWSYDTADRYDTGSGYSYDSLGRVTTIPANDTPKGDSAGAITLGYYDTDAVRTIAQNGTTSAYTLDAAGRRAVEATGPTGGPATTTVTSHFTDSADNPTWVQQTTNGTTSTSRFVDSLGGDLAATLASSGAELATGADLTLAIANPHGDVVTTVPVPAAGPAVGIDAWYAYDEYGNSASIAVDRAPYRASIGIDYGWVGVKQRATQNGGLVLMGARVYNAATGAFTSTDPIFGGNSTTYAYPQDPVNWFDLTGLLAHGEGCACKGSGGRFGGGTGGQQTGGCGGCTSAPIVITSTASSSPIWRVLKPFRGKIRTNGKSGKAQEFYEWDRTHKDIEVYNSKGRHLGSKDPRTGKMYKPPVKGRRIDL